MGAESRRRSGNFLGTSVKRRGASGGADRKEVVKGVPPEGKTGAKQVCQGIEAWPEVWTCGGIKLDSEDDKAGQLD